jgi:hypothetical protein
VSDATPPNTSERTRPLAGTPAPVERDPTETLPGTKPDLPAVALLGSVAYRGSRLRKRIANTLGPLWGRGWNRVVLAASLGVVVVLLGTSLVNSGPDLVEVPDIRGRPYVEAGDLLRRQGLTTDRASFAPARADQAGLVVDTIPAAGSKVKSGTVIHMIAGAAPPTPGPIATEQPVEGGGGKGKGNERRGRDRDDG